MPYIQCPKCDSLKVKTYFEEVYKCDYCGKTFVYRGRDKVAPMLTTIM